MLSKKTLIYQSNFTIITGTSYSEILEKALLFYHPIKKHTKRRPYIRSRYFNKQKIFFDVFWQHLAQKSYKDRIRRLKLFICTIDLIRNTRYKPVLFNNPMNHQENLYRFYGQTKQHETFYVQIKENKRTGQKYFMSVFPE